VIWKLKVVAGKDINILVDKTLPENTKNLASLCALHVFDVHAWLSVKNLTIRCKNLSYM